MIDQHEKVFQTTLYTKTEIQSLCKAYGLVYRKNDSKAKLSERLIPAIKQSTYIPCHLALCDTHQEPSTPALTINNDDQHVQTPLQGTAHETIGHRYMLFMQYLFKFILVKCTCILWLLNLIMFDMYSHAGLIYFRRNQQEKR